MTILQHIYRLLEDGIRRSGAQIATEISATTEFAQDSVYVTVSERLPHDWRYERTRKKRVFIYRYVGRGE